MATGEPVFNYSDVWGVASTTSTNSITMMPYQGVQYVLQPNTYIPSLQKEAVKKDSWIDDELARICLKGQQELSFA